MNRIVNLHRPAFALLLIVFLLLASGQARSQERSSAQQDLVKSSLNFEPPFAGKYEARIGSSYEPAAKKLRLDIGGSVDLYDHSSNPAWLSPVAGDDPASGEVVPADHLSLGTDFFTWTRLRATADFKFPVEAVDYYFGVNGALRYARALLSDVRLRVAHISAHLVDGDPSFTDPEAQYMTYSREFVDLMAGFSPEVLNVPGASKHHLRPYVGALWLFHTIPDTLGRITPYAGIDGYWELSPAVPLSLKFGYEARLNTELEPIGEHLLRFGVKLAPYAERVNGLLIEGSYYAGRSPYGQHFARRESFWSIGFAAEF